VMAGAIRPGKVLVTGAAGFIGSHFAERVLSEGRHVVALDNFDGFYDPAVKRRNVAAALGSAGYRLVEGDIRDGRLLERLFREERPDAVVHLAARAGVRPSIADPALCSSVNLDGTTRLLEAARRAGVARFVFGSSSSVYGNNEKVPFAEDDPVDRPISPYAATKRAGELLAHTFHHLYGMEVGCVRFFTVFGPRQRPDLAIHKFARRMADGHEIEQFGDGSSARDYTYVDDIVEGLVRVLDRVRGFRIWNLGGSRPVPLSVLVERIASGLGVEPRLKILPPQPGDVERTWADVSRARDELEWTPRVDFELGLRLFLEWFRAEHSSARTEKDT
jgi:UDP-glucuronate 4-epimerase